MTDNWYNDFLIESKYYMAKLSESVVFLISADKRAWEPRFGVQSQTLLRYQVHN